MNPATNPAAGSSCAEESDPDGILVAFHEDAGYRDLRAWCWPARRRNLPCAVRTRRRSRQRAGGQARAVRWHDVSRRDRAGRRRKLRQGQDQGSERRRSRSGYSATAHQAMHREARKVSRGSRLPRRVARAVSINFQSLDGNLVICPSCQNVAGVVVERGRKSPAFSAYPVPARGACRPSRNVGRGERWARRVTGRVTLSRTAKSRGPDAPMLASSS